VRRVEYNFLGLPSLRKKAMITTTTAATPTTTPTSKLSTVAKSVERSTPLSVPV